MRSLLQIYLFLFCLSTLSAQKVGLVLSGGGAKGLAHIGVIKALEENQIPIDYITGTSMGAIIGSLYAIGYSPQEMIDLFLSDEFESWSTGRIDPKYRYYYKQKSAKPDFFTIRLNVGDSIKFKTNIPSFVVSPTPMNIAFLKLFKAASHYCNDNFDNLLIPFRCVSSNIYSNKTVIHSQGDLGEAVRSSMTIPFYFKPIKINDTLLFDGGVYNNFPVDVMVNDFKPDYLIGSSVNKTYQLSEMDNVMMQLESLIMSKNDLYRSDSSKILIETVTDDVDILNFKDVERIAKLGYDATMELMPQIKADCKRRVDSVLLNESRLGFIHSLSDIEFKNIQFNGLTPSQMRYVMNYFDYREKSFSFDFFQQVYYKLVSDPNFKEIYPRALYNPDTGYFDLLLDVVTDNTVIFKFGGNFSTGSSSQGFLSLERRYFLTNLYEYSLDMHFGNIYNALKVGASVGFPSRRPYSLNVDLLSHRTNYFQNNRQYFYEPKVPSFLSEAETRLTSYISSPVFLNSRIEAGVDLALTYQSYGTSESGISVVSANKTAFKNSIKSIALFGLIEHNTLNNKQYATTGISRIYGLNYVRLTNQYIPNGASNLTENSSYQYVMANFSFEHYKRLNKFLALGSDFGVVYSSIPMLNDETTTSLLSPTYRPTPFSKTIFLPDYAAPSYVSVALKPIYNFNPNVHLRLSGFGFIPIQQFGYNFGTLQKSVNVDFRFIGEAALVANIKVGQVSLAANYFSRPVGAWYVGLNFGYLIFNRKSLNP